jgi:alpha-tubulin suppressor-like RCC1 family protein
MGFSGTHRIAAIALRPIFALSLACAFGHAHAQYVPLADVVQIASGWAHTCAIVGAGAVKCWGTNVNGALGDGTTSDRSTPVDVVGLQGGVTALAVGSAHTCALTAAGGVKCWGFNGSGELGDGTHVQRLVPVDVVGLHDGVIAIAAGDDHTCAVTSTGRVMCWGYNFWGQLGDGTQQSRSSPVLLESIAGVDAITAGFDFTCALGAGSVACWGSNAYGQIGDGNGSGTRLDPSPVVGLEAGVRSIDASAQHTCATMANNAVKCWGMNLSGELGDGTTLPRSTPVDVVGLGSAAQVARSGSGYSCALLDTGGIECWGTDFLGTLGNGMFQQSLAPVPVEGLTGALAIDASDTHACAVTSAHRAVCWGDNFYGQLGNAMTTQRLTPVDVVGIGAVDAVSMGFVHTCALTATSTVACWGNNYSGQLGDGTTVRRLVPTAVTSLGTGVQAVASGHHHSCAIDASGSVKCWGENQYGQLGDGTTNDHTTPVAVSVLGVDNLAVAAGWSHTCAITSAGGVKCWGDNGSGQLGDGSTTQRDAPVDVVGLASGVRALAVGEYHTCALMQTGGIKCWGDNWSGELGTGVGPEQTTPVDVPGLASGVRAISANSIMTCAVTDAGAAKCWGYGIVGNGSPEGSSPTPVDIVGLSSGVVAITQGDLHVCAHLADRVSCWGRNDYGQLGDGSRETRLVPTDVVGLGGPIQAVSAGSESTCAVISPGTLKCWGNNRAGQLGDGTSEGVPLPQIVVVPGDAIFSDGFE